MSKRREKLVVDEEYLLKAAASAAGCVPSWWIYEGVIMPEEIARGLKRLRLRLRRERPKRRSITITVLP